jgi:hypothetical protein
VRLPIPQRFVNLVVTNVPGPQFPLHMADRELKDIFPLVPIGNNMGLGIAIVSYNGTIDLGLVGDWSALPDLDELGELFADSIREMGEAAGVQVRADAPAPRSGSRPAPTNGGAPERGAPYEPDPEYQDRTETLVMERPVFPEEPVVVEEELVEQVAERGAETAPGPEIKIAEPWEGYARMKVGEIRDRLAAVDTATAGMVEIYERANKNRKSVIEASERAQRRARD